jgi:hypothetical protein
MSKTSDNYLYNAVRFIFLAKWIESNKVLQGIPNDLKYSEKYVRNENYSNFPS